MITTTFGGGRLPFSQLAADICRVGPESSVIATDFVQPDNLPPPEGLALYLDQLRQHGFKQAEIDRMARTNPAELLGL